MNWSFLWETIEVRAPKNWRNKDRDYNKLIKWVDGFAVLTVFIFRVTLNHCSELSACKGVLWIFLLCPVMLIQGFPARDWIGMREYFVSGIKKSFWYMISEGNIFTYRVRVFLITHAVKWLFSAKEGDMTSILSGRYKLTT